MADITYLQFLATIGSTATLYGMLSGFAVTAPLAPFGAFVFCCSSVYMFEKMNNT